MLRKSGDSTRKSSADPEAPFEMFLMRKIRNYGLQTEGTSAG